MLSSCVECFQKLESPEYFGEGEIITCPDCGLDYVIEFNKNGTKILIELTLEGEDWGE
jgi:hypothetical protein